MLLRRSETGGAFLLVEDSMTRGKMTPLHQHPDSDESMYVLEGEILMHMDGAPSRSKVSHAAAEDDQQPDGASDDHVGSVGFGALHVEPAEGLEQFQAGGDEQRGSRPFWESGTCGAHVAGSSARGETMSVRFPGESAEYRAARDRLLHQESELRRAMEEVAVARRRLPAGGVVPEDYVFRGRGADGGLTDVRLSELFAPGKDSLVIYSMMFPRDPEDDRPGPSSGRTALLPLLESPCPSCTALLDQLDGAAEHASQRINLAAVGKAPLSHILGFAADRGWRRLRLLSSLDNTYNRDYHAETADGHQRPMLNVFHRDGDALRHFWGSELLYAPTEPGQDPRHVGTIEPLWNLFDLTPAGRGTDWDEQLSYS